MGMSIEEVAKELGMTRRQVINVEFKALRKVKAYFIKCGLQEIWDEIECKITEVDYIIYI